MSYTTFKIAKGYVARGLGNCSEDDRAEAVNTIRKHWFNWHSDVALFLDVAECYAVQRFCFDCRDCRDSYRGITLPREAQTVEAMWLNDWPVRLQSSWREFQTGIRGECDCRLEKFDVPGSFSTACDIRPGMPVRLRVLAQNSADIGKTIILRGEAASGAPHVETIVLTTEPQETVEAYALIDARGGVVKEVTVGRVALAEDNGRLLGMYEPEETVPSYRRIKINGLPDDCEVLNVRCSRRYYPLIGDNDVVETDNEPAFDAMARYLRAFRKQGKTEVDMREEQTYLATARAHVLGDHARERGKATQSEVKIMVPTFGGARLHRTNFRGPRRF